MKVGIYYAFWENEWEVSDFVPYIKKVSSLGFDVLEVQAGVIADMSKAQRETLKKAAADHGVSMSCCIGLPPCFDISSSDSSVRKAGIARLNGIGRAMADCGIDRLTGIIYCCWPTSLESRNATKKQSWDWSVASMKEAIRTAEDLSLTYNVEVVNRFEQFLVNTCEEGLAYISDVESPNIKLLLDTFHMNIEEDSIGSAIEKAGDNLGHLHIGENNRKPPGYGHISWEEVMMSLKKIRFSGFIVMEPFIVPGGSVGRDIRVYRQIMPGADLDLEAKKACSFIKTFIG